MGPNDSQVKRMFESIAFSYDFQNSFLSLGQDIHGGGHLPGLFRRREEALSWIWQQAQRSWPWKYAPLIPG